MMALNLHGVGDLRYEEVPCPERKPGEVHLSFPCFPVASARRVRRSSMPGAPPTTIMVLAGSVLWLNFWQ